MREILFRGKKLGNGQWIYGLPTYDMEYVFGEDDLDSPDSYMVDVNTVGQHIGFSDKNGVKIFEGDIIKYHEKYDGIESATIGGHVVYGDCVFYVKGKGVGNDWRLSDLDKNTSLEVVGNIYDNKELID